MNHAPSDTAPETLSDYDLLEIHGGGSRMTASGRVVSDEPMTDNTVINVYVPLPGNPNAFTVERRTLGEALAMALAASK